MTLLTPLAGCRSWRAATKAVDVASARNLTFHGLNALHRGDVGQAEALLKQAAEACPTDQRIRQHLATAMVQNGSVDGAIEQLQRALEHSPNDPRLHVELGKLYLGRNQIQPATKHADIALRIDRQSAIAWHLKGQCQTILGNLDEAISSYHRACNCDSASPSIQLQIAKIYRHQNRPLQALNALSLYNEKFPSDQVPLPAIVLMADTMADLNQHQRANTMLAQAVERTDATADTWLALSKTQANLGDFSEATMTTQRAAQLFPDSRPLQDWSTELASLSNSSDDNSRTAALPSADLY